MLSIVWRGKTPVLSNIRLSIIIRFCGLVSPLLLFFRIGDRSREWAEVGIFEGVSRGVGADSAGLSLGGGVVDSFFRRTVGAILSSMGGLLRNYATAE